MQNIRLFRRLLSLNTCGAPTLEIKTGTKKLFFAIAVARIFVADVVNPFHLMLNTLQRCFMLHIYASLPVYSKFLLWPDSDGHANESHYKPKLAVIIHIKNKMPRHSCIAEP